MGSKKILGLLWNRNYFELSEFGALGLSFECNLFEHKSKRYSLSQKALINKIKKFYHVKYKHRTKSKAS